MRIPTRLKPTRPGRGGASRSIMKGPTHPAWRAMHASDRGRPGNGCRRAVAALTAIVMLAGAGSAQAKPVKLVPSSHITSGFQYPESVAVSPSGNIYVADRGNHRVQELTATGEFVLMFGKEVNETTKGDICTAASENKCKAGVQGAAAGDLDELLSVAVDPAGGDVYVAEGVGNGYRVQKFTAEGQFVLEIGKQVNETTKGNLCTAEEVKNAGVKCAGPAPSVPGEHGSFEFSSFAGNLLAVGPAPEHLLYVGDKQRIQEFNTAGEWKAEIPLTAISAEPRSHVQALAVDQTTGDLYLVYNVFVPYGGSISEHEIINIVREFNPSGVEVTSFTVTPRRPGREVLVQGIALDSEGQLAVSAYESNEGGPFGSLYAAGTGQLITRFTMSRGTASTGLAFDGKSELFAVQRENAEVAVYKPVNVAELTSLPVSCVPGVEEETDVTLDCSLRGEVNPWGVPATEVWFEWGRTVSLGEKTPVQVIKEPPGEVSLPLSAEVAGVHPNEQGFSYRLVGFDANSPSSEGEPLSSAVVSFTTPMTTPRILGAPSAPFVRSSSAVIFAELNPENATTSYEFQYGSCENLENCPSRTQTPALGSAQYGEIGATQEVIGLQPATTYRYRLLAESENAQKTEKRAATGAEGSFTTAPAPIPQAATGAPTQVGATTATISGTVNPDGQPAAYAFELGVYQGAATQYGIVLSGPAGTGTLPATETLGLTGLQPGTTYAYRIKIASGYGTATGEAALFTTAGLPSVLLSPTPLAMLAIPNIAFPAAAKPGKPAACKRGYKRDKHNKCVKPKKKAKTNKRKPHKGKK
jgi:NHL repeat